MEKMDQYLFSILKKSYFYSVIWLIKFKSYVQN
jgi:hypothetical protein